MKVVSAATLATSTLFVAAAWAHHGWSGYETTATQLSGTITTSSYANPHGAATLKTADATWDVVLAPPARMESRGLSREMLAPGTAAQVEGYVHLQNRSELRAE